MSDHLPESFSLASILAEQGVHHQEGLRVKMIGERQPITIKFANHVAEQFSCIPLPYLSPTWHPLLIKSLALTAHVSPWKIHFWVLDKSPLLGPGRGLLPAT